MIGSTLSHRSFLATKPFPSPRVESIAELPVRRRRRLDRESGQAIEKLGHAIQYLADEFALDCMNPSDRPASGLSPRMEAIQLLMAFNRQIYMNCPPIPSFAQRLRAWFGLRHA